MSAVAPVDETVRPHQDRALLLFLVARVVAVAGSAVTGVALPLLVLQLSGSAFLTALVAAGQVAPYLVFGLLAGAVADRVSRRRLMVAAQLVSALALASVPVAHATGLLTVGHLLAVAVVVASSFVWFDAAAFGALPAIAGRERIVAANSLVWTTTTLVAIAAPALGGVLVAWLGAAPAVGLDALAYLLATATLMLIAVPFGPLTPRERSAPLRTDIVDGLRFVLRHPTVRDLTLVGVGNSVAGGAVTALLAVLADAGLAVDRDGRGYGVMLAVVAAGGFLAASALPWLSRRVPIGWLTLGGLGLGVPTTAGLAAVPAFPVALVLLVGWAFANTLVVLNGIATRQRVTPDHLQARVNTTARMIAWGGAPVGAVAAGLVAELRDVPTALAGAAAVLAATVLLATTTGLRRRDFGAC
ncbi:MFS transporter [Nocardioides sp. R1-1]|uniref:MFS transporter n=1 Tax=Nocardioides sp. R1-1 TaxID=3383502 RepID=UPI0038D09CFF